MYACGCMQLCTCVLEFMSSCEEIKQKKKKLENIVAVGIFVLNMYTQKF